MGNPKISVIVPVYNVEKYLPRCIDSILAQTFTDFELLLIDDGSKDSSGRICDEKAKKDNRIKVFHKENGGVSSARNLGLDNANGDWIVFVDGDDWVEDCWLQNVSDLMNREYVDSLCWNYFQDISGKSSLFYPIERGLWIEKGNIAMRHLVLKTIYPEYALDKGKHVFGLSPVWNKLYLRSVLDKHDIRFDVRLKRAEDVLFNLQYFQRVTSVAFVGACYTHYVIHPTSVMQSVNDGLLYVLMDSVKAIYEKLNSKDNLTLQCYMGRVMGYIDEYFKRCLFHADKPYVVKVKKLAEMCRLITDFPEDFKLNGNILTVPTKLGLVLAKRKASHSLYAYLGIKNMVKRLLKK